MVRIPDLSKRRERPRAAIPHEAQNVAEVVREDDAREPRAVAQARDLEDLLFLLEEVFRVLARRVDPRAALVEVEELARDVLTGTLESHQNET